MDDWLTIVLALGLAMRMTRLITLDAITQPIRDRLTGFWGALAECPWCTGVWIAVPVGLSWWAWSDHTWWQVIALIGLISWGAGAGAGVGMPKQMEVATVSPVALVNADGPPMDTVESGIDSAITDSDVEAAIARVLKRQAGEAS